MPISLSGQQNGWSRSLLVRRSLTDPTQLAYLMVFAPNGTSISEAVQVAGRRWNIEMGFEITKDELGLDHYEVRSAASMVSAYHVGTVSSRCAISHSRSGSDYDRSIGGSNELKLLPWTLPEVKRLLWLLLWSTKPHALHRLALVDLATTKARARTAVPLSTIRTTHTTE